MFAAGAKGVVVASRGPKKDPNTEECLNAMRERANGGKLAYIPFNVMEAEKAKDFVQQAEAELGEIHGLVSYLYRALLFLLKFIAALLALSLFYAIHY